MFWKWCSSHARPQVGVVCLWRHSCGKTTKLNYKTTKRPSYTELKHSSLVATVVFYLLSMCRSSCCHGNSVHGHENAPFLMSKWFWKTNKLQAATFMTIIAVTNISVFMSSMTCTSIELLAIVSRWLTGEPHRLPWGDLLSSRRSTGHGSVAWALQNRLFTSNRRKHATPPPPLWFHKPIQGQSQYVIVFLLPFCFCWTAQSRNILYSLAFLSPPSPPSVQQNAPGWVSVPPLK